jgi:hypothetical protein
MERTHAENDAEYLTSLGEGMRQAMSVGSEQLVRAVVARWQAVGIEPLVEEPRLLAWVSSVVGTASDEGWGSQSVGE